MRKLLIATVTLSVLAACPGRGSAAEAEFHDNKWLDSAAPAEGSPPGELALIRKKLRDGKNRQAFKRAKKFVRTYPDDPGTEEALCLAGEAQLARGRYWSAHDWYEKQISRFPMGELLSRALVRQAAIADAFLAGRKRRVWGIFRLGAKQEGVMIHERIIDRVPGTKLAEQSLMSVGDHQFAQKQWEEAAYTYQRHQELFRGRYRSQEAEFKAAQATYRNFRGVDHDDTPLVEAEQRFNAFAARYPQTLRGRRARDAADEIRRIRARKDYDTARFYARIGRQEPARLYYRQVVDLYDDTVWAENSREALSRLGESAPPRGSTAPSPAGQGDAPDTEKPESLQKGGPR